MSSTLPPTSRSPFRSSCASVAAFLALGTLASAFQSVLVVNGGSGAALQNAVAAAAEGDTVLVHGGTFGAVLVASKSIAIVSDPAGSTVVESVTITGLSLNQRAVVSGLRVVTPAVSGGNPPPDCIRIENCVGSVRIESVNASLVEPNGNPALRAVNASDVAIANSALVGSRGASSTAWILATNPGAAIDSTQSSIAAYDCTLNGGTGMSGFTQSPCSSPFVWFPTPGAAGVALDANSTFLANGGAIAGGVGGNATPARCDCFLNQLIPGSPGATGGAAIANAVGSIAQHVDAVLTGGAGGNGSGNVNCGSGPGGASMGGASGSISTNPVVAFAGPPLRLESPTIVRTGQPIAITLHGTPGHTVFLGRSFETRWILNVPALGVLLTGPTGRRFPVGVVPANGMLSVVLPAAALPAGAQAQQWYLQAFARDPSNSLRIGAGRVLTLVDAAF